MPFIGAIIHTEGNDCGSVKSKMLVPTTYGLVDK